MRAPVAGGTPPAPAVIQVVPPLAGGVADHAECLRRQWAGDMATASHWPVWPLHTAGPQAMPLADRLRLAAGAPGVQRVLLHFSGYGYHPRGLCHGLLRELRAARYALGPRLRLVVMFHELFATGEPPWRSAFWLSPWQRAIAADLARQADAIVTNTEAHAAWLRTAAPHAAVHAWPVFSNVGEAGPGVGHSGRKPALVVFGSPSTRHRAWQALRQLDPQGMALRSLGVEEVLEVGPPAAAGFDALPVRALGRLDAAELGALLGRCRYGLIEYPGPFLAKSSVFAAYAAHGCTVLNLAPPADECDGLAAGVHYLNLPGAHRIQRAHPGHPGERPGVPADRAAEAAWQWYAAHRLARQAEAFLGVLEPAAAPAARRPDQESMVHLAH